MMGLANMNIVQERELRQKYGAGMRAYEGRVADNFYDRHQDKPKEVVERYIRMNETKPGLRGELEWMCEALLGDGTRRLHMLAARRILRDKEVGARS